MQKRKLLKTLTFQQGLLVSLLVLNFVHSFKEDVSTLDIHTEVSFLKTALPSNADMGVPLLGKIVILEMPS